MGAFVIELSKHENALDLKITRHNDINCLKYSLLAL